MSTATRFIGIALTLAVAFTPALTTAAGRDREPSELQKTRSDVDEAKSDVDKAKNTAEKMQKADRDGMKGAATDRAKDEASDAARDAARDAIR